MFIGIDGAKDQWMVTILDGNQQLEFRQYASFGDLWVHHGNRSDKILIDIPLGLTPPNGGFRACDVQARDDILSTFPGAKERCFIAPSHRAVKKWAELKIINEIAGAEIHDKNDIYQQSSYLHLQDTTHKLTPYNYPLIPKINQVRNDLLNWGADHKTAESHPEICFWALNGNQVLTDKKEPRGYIERIHVINKHFTDFLYLASQTSTWHSSVNVKMDDLLDSVILAITAKIYALDPSRRLKLAPSIRQQDPDGLWIEMEYVQ